MPKGTTDTTQARRKDHPMFYDYEAHQAEVAANMARYKKTVAAEKRAKTIRIKKARGSADGVVLTLHHEDGASLEGFATAAEAIEWAEAHYEGHWYAGRWTTPCGQVIEIEKGEAVVLAAIAARRDAAKAEEDAAALAEIAWGAGPCCDNPTSLCAACAEAREPQAKKPADVADPAELARKLAIKHHGLSSGSCLGVSDAGRSYYELRVDLIDDDGDLAELHILYTVDDAGNIDAYVTSAQDVADMIDMLALQDDRRRNG